MAHRFLLPIALLLAAGACGAPTSETEVEARPKPPLALTGRVVDAANLLDEKTEAYLKGEIMGIETATTDQLVVVTTPDLEGDSIEDYSLRLGNGWGVGSKGTANGVLLVVAPNERRVRIEVGYGLEGLLTDEKAKQIIDDELLPDFKAGDFRKGIMDGVSAIGATLRSDRRRPQPKPMRAAA